MPTLNIFVTLDTEANPQVILKDSAGNSARDETTASGNTIKWQKQDNNDKFKITGLAPTGTGEAFSTPTQAPGNSGQWLQSEFYPPTGDPPDTAYSYTLTVTDEDGGEHTTTQTENAPDDGRPVIRN